MKLMRKVCEKLHIGFHMRTHEEYVKKTRENFMWKSCETGFSFSHAKTVWNSCEMFGTKITKLVMMHVKKNR